MRKRSEREPFLFPFFSPVLSLSHPGLPLPLPLPSVSLSLPLNISLVLEFHRIFYFFLIFFFFFFFFSRDQKPSCLRYYLSIGKNRTNFDERYNKKERGKSNHSR